MTSPPLWNPTPSLTLIIHLLTCGFGAGEFCAMTRPCSQYPPPSEGQWRSLPPRICSCWQGKHFSPVCGASLVFPHSPCPPPHESWLQWSVSFSRSHGFCIHRGEQSARYPVQLAPRISAETWSWALQQYLLPPCDSEMLCSPAAFLPDNLKKKNCLIKRYRYLLVFHYPLIFK